MGHEITAISIPSFLVLAGILLNQVGRKSLREDMHREFDRVYAWLDTLQNDLNSFHRSLGQHDKALEVLEKKV